VGLSVTTSVKSEEFDPVTITSMILGGLPSLKLGKIE